MKTEHWVEYHIPGTLFTESETHKLSSRSVSEAVKYCPEYAFGFHLFDVEIRSGVLEDGERIEKKKVVNESGRYYPQGKVYDRDDVKSMGSKYHSLLSNMESHGWSHVVRTRRGNFQPFESQDHLL